MSIKKNCFVISGFGPKTDYETGRVIDLDKTFEHLIEPVFKELNINCFRASEIRHSGVIDVPMYEWIYKADIVVADVSTLNPNALYELGVRHALRPNTTIVISETQTRYPFDLSHTIISKYEHLGKDIGVTEANRFKKQLKKLVQKVLKEQKNDSPVYTYLPKLKPPVFSNAEIDRLTQKADNQVSLSELISNAEEAKENSDFRVAIELYKVCLKFEPKNSFLIQRLALVTYKSKKPNTIQALKDAEKILAELNPSDSTDVETLGLSGAINKRLYEETGNIEFIDKSIQFYAKGFHIARDHYNGINYAYLLTLKATLQKDKLNMTSFFRQSQRIREDIVLVCINLIKQKDFQDRDDRQWIYQSLAQAYLALENHTELEKIIIQVQKLSKGSFDMNTFEKHNENLIKYIKYIKSKKAS